MASGRATAVRPRPTSLRRRRTAIAARLGAGAAGRTGSPTAAAISAAAAYLTGMQTDHPQYLMLVTDHAPTCAGISEPLSADPAAAQADALAAINAASAASITTM